MAVKSWRAADGAGARRCLAGTSIVRAESLSFSIRPASRREIRAFFVRPGWERRGIGSALVRACEQAALAEGFREIEMASTLTGVALYSAHGYKEVERIDVPMENGLTLPVIRMAKRFSKS